MVIKESKKWISIFLVLTMLFSAIQASPVQYANAGVNNGDKGNITEQLLDNDGNAYLDIDVTIVSDIDDTILANAKSDGQGFVKVYDMELGAYRMRIAADLIDNGLQGSGWQLVDKSNEENQSEENAYFNNIEEATTEEAETEEMSAEEATQLDNNEIAFRTNNSLIDMVKSNTPLGSTNLSYYEKTVYAVGNQMFSSGSTIISTGSTLTIGNADLSASLGYYKDENTLDYTLDDGIKTDVSFLMSKYLVLKFYVLRSANEDEVPIFEPGSIKIWLPEIPGGTPSIDKADEVFSIPKKDGETGKWYIENVKSIDGVTTVSYPVRYTINTDTIEATGEYSEDLTISLDDLTAYVDIDYEDDSYKFSTVDEVSYKFTRTRSVYQVYKDYYTLYNDNRLITYDYNKITIPDGGGENAEQDYKEKYYWGEWKYRLSLRNQYNFKYNTEGLIRDTIPYNGEVAQVRGTTKSNAGVVLWDINKGFLPIWNASTNSYEVNPDATTEFVEAFIKSNFHFSKLEIASGQSEFGAGTHSSDYKTVNVFYDNIEKTTISEGGNGIQILTRFEKESFDTVRDVKNPVENRSYLDCKYSIKTNGENLVSTVYDRSSATLRAIRKNPDISISYKPNGAKISSKPAYYKTDLAEDNQAFTFELRPYVNIYKVVDGVATHLTSVDKADAYDIIVEDSGIVGRETTDSSGIDIPFNDYVFTKAYLYNANGTVDTTDYIIYVKYAGESEYELFTGDSGSGTIPKASYGEAAKEVDLTTTGKEIIAVKVLYKDIYNYLGSYMYLKLDGYFKESETAYENLNYVRNYMDLYVYNHYDEVDEGNSTLAIAFKNYVNVSIYDRTHSAYLEVIPHSYYSFSTKSDGLDGITWGVSLASARDNLESMENLKNFTIIDVLPKGTRLKNKNYSLNGSDASAAIQILQKHTGDSDYEFPDIKEALVTEIIDADGIVRDKITIRFESDPNNEKQMMYKNNMTLEFSFDTYISEHSAIDKAYTSNYTAVVLNDSDYEQGRDFYFHRYFTYYYDNSLGIRYLSLEDNTVKKRSTAEKAEKNNGQWKFVDSLDINGDNMWIDELGTGREYVAWTYETATLSYDISIGNSIDNSTYPSEYKDAGDFKYDIDSDLYRCRLHVPISQKSTSNALYARNFTFVDILPEGVKLVNGEASVSIAPIGISGYKMPDYRIIVDENYKGTGRDRVMVIFTSDEDNPLQLFYAGMIFNIYMDTVLTEFDGSASTKVASHVTSIVHKDFEYKKRGASRSTGSSIFFNTGLSYQWNESAVRFGRTDTLFDNLDELPGSSIYDDNGANDAAMYSTRNIQAKRYLSESGNTYVEQIKTDIYNFKKGISESNFAKPAEIKMTVASSASQSTKGKNIILYNFLPRLDDSLTSEFDVTFKDVSWAQGNPIVYYTTSEAVKGIADENEMKAYTLKSNASIWKVYDADVLSDEEKSKITGIAMDFGDYELLNNTTIDATITVMMPNIDNELIGKIAYSKYYTEFDSVTGSVTTHYDPVPSNTIRVKLIPPRLHLGDTVFLDENNNGVMDSGEVGVDGITINVYKIDNEVEVWKGSTVTEGGGKYALTITGEGDYRLKFTVPSKLGDIPPKFSDHVNTFTSTKADQALKKNIVFADGYTESIGFYYNDFDDFNGKEICEYKNVNAGLTSIYSLILGDTVFLDTNNNGILDEGTDDIGLGGISVELYEEDGASPIETTATDAQGNYHFIINESGSYYVKINLSAGYLETYSFYFAKHGENTEDSIQKNNVDTDGKSDIITFSAEDARLAKKNKEVYWLDAALISPITMNINGMVFKDIDGDGIMGMDEAPLSDIDVILYREARDTDSADIIEIINGKELVAVGNRTTDENGAYSFTVAEEGTYYVWVDSSSKYDYGTLNPTPIDENQIVNTLDEGGFTEPIDFNYEPDKTIYETKNIDGGLVVAKGNLKITKVDKDSKDDIEGPVYLAGAEFKLVDGSGNDYKTGIITDEYGEAIVNGIPVGTYTLEEVTAPVGYAFPLSFKWTVGITKNVSAEKEIENSKLPTLFIKKIKAGTIGENAVTLSGATFKLLDSDNEIYKENITTDITGKVKIEGIPYGSYTLVETKAPKGYKLNNDKFTITISESSPMVVEIIVENSPVSKPPAEETERETEATTETGRETEAGTETSEEPGTETSEEPGTETSEEPGTETSEEAGTETSEEPDTETREETGTEADDTDNTDDEVIVEPINPIIPDTRITVINDNNRYDLVYDDDMGMYMVFDEFGTPLGWIELSDDMSLEDFNILENLVPLSTGILKLNPKTGDKTAINLGALIILAFALVLIYKRKGYGKE